MGPTVHNLEEDGRLQIGYFQWDTVWCNTPAYVRIAGDPPFFNKVLLLETKCGSKSYDWEKVTLHSNLQSSRKGGHLPTGGTRSRIRSIWIKLVSEKNQETVRKRVTAGSCQNQGPLTPSATQQALLKRKACMIDTISNEDEEPHRKAPRPKVKNEPKAHLDYPQPATLPIVGISNKNATGKKGGDTIQDIVAKLETQSEDLDKQIAAKEEEKQTYLKKVKAEKDGMFAQKKKFETKLEAFRSEMTS